MLSFLFNDVHWLWRILNVVHGVIHDWKTFCAVLFLGVVQAVIASESGVLAVKGVVHKLSPFGRRLHLICFVVFGVLLFLLTTTIGYLNDQNQFEADKRAADAVILQQQTEQTSIQSAFGVQEVKDLMKARVPYPQILQRLDRIQQALTSVPVLEAPRGDFVGVQRIDKQANLDGERPLTLLTNVELRENSLALSHRLHSDIKTIYDAVDEVGSTRRHLEEAATNPQQSSHLTTAINQFSDKTQALAIIMGHIVDQDAPDTTKYRDELIRRLGPKSVPKRELPIATTNFVSLDAFLGLAWIQLNDLAQQLPAGN